MLLWLLWTYFC